jgi:hypothetical protein
LVGQNSPDRPDRPNERRSLAGYREKEWLCHEMVGEEHVLKPMSAKDDLLASGKLVDAIEDLVPGVLRHKIDERIQTNDGLLTEMIENRCRENIGTRILTLQRLNIRS